MMTEAKNHVNFFLAKYVEINQLFLYVVFDIYMYW